MTPNDFVGALRRSVIDANAGIYRDLFTGTDPAKASDPYWRRALTLFSSLAEDEREVFFEVVRQIAVDTTSNLLGVIDGVSSIGPLAGVELRDGRGDKLSGDLQDLFLAAEEDDAKD